MKKIITILLLAMLVASMPMAMAETGTEDVDVSVVLVSSDSTENSTILVIIGDKQLSFIHPEVGAVYSDIVKVTYTYNSTASINIEELQANIINAIQSELDAQNTTVIFNETTFQNIVNREVQASRADEQAWIENTWMATAQDLANMTTSRDEWKLEAGRLQIKVDQHLPDTIRLEDKISDLQNTVWAAGIFILILCIALVYFILMVVKPSMGRLLKKGGDN